MSPWWEAPYFDRLIALLPREPTAIDRLAAIADPTGASAQNIRAWEDHRRQCAEMYERYMTRLRELSELGEAATDVQ